MEIGLDLRKGRKVYLFQSEKTEGTMDGVSTAWMVAGSGWICTCIVVQTLGVGGWRALLVGVDTGEIWRDRGGSAEGKEEG